MFDKLVDLAIQFAKLFAPFIVVHEFERGVVLRWGHYHHEIGPGFHWKIPFDIDYVLHDNVVPRTINLKAQSLTTADNKSVVVGAVVTARITDVRKALLEVETVGNVLEDSCYGMIGLLVASHTWGEIRAEAFCDVLTKACRKRAWRYGMEIMIVQLSDFAPARPIRLYTEPARLPSSS